MALPSSALRRCFDSAAAASQPALRRCLEQTVSLLQTAESQAHKQEERRELGDACRHVIAHSSVWVGEFPEQLKRAFTEALKPAKPEGRAAAPTKFGELTLVDDADVIQAIESSRLLQHVLPIVERPVSELDALVSTALGHETVRPELNPVRPEIFAQALRAAIGPSPANGPPNTLWIRYLAEPLGRELQTIYAKMVELLHDANVQAAGYKVSTSASAPAPLTESAPAGNREQGRQASQGKPGGHGNHGRDADSEFPPTLPPGHHGFDDGGPVFHGNLSSRQLSQALLRDFLVHGLGPEATHALPASYYEDVEHELAALQAQTDSAHAPLQHVPAAYRAMPVVDRPVRSVGVGSTLDPQVWGTYARSRERSLVRTHLRKDATRVGQVLGLELVRNVVDKVAQDPRLLAPVREAIVALEPSLLRLAMLDPRFLSEETHPARDLMERVAQRSFKYNDEFSSEFASFFQDIGSQFNQLNGLDQPDAEPFEAAVAQLEQRWQESDAREEEQKKPAMDALLFAERRQAEAGQIAWTLSSRPDLENVPAVVQDFLFGPWALVIAHDRLTAANKEIDPHGYTAVITDLLWSVKREVTLKQPAQLFQRIPGLLATLRAGLASIGQETAETEPFFQALMKLHHPVLKLRRARTRQDALESGAAPLMQVRTPEAEDAVVAPSEKGQLWMSPKELDAAGFEETLPTDMAELGGSESSGAPVAPAQQAQAEQREADADEIMANLREGNWVDLYSKRRWLRAQLTWASSKATLFMFVSHGGQPHTMTKRICRRLIEERFLRPVHTDAVVATALESVGRDAAAAAEDAPGRPAPSPRPASRSRAAAVAG